MNLNEWTGSLIRSFDEIAGRIQLYMPALLGAIGLLILGWLVGRLLKSWSVRIMTRVERRLEGHALRSASSRLGVERSASEVIGSFVFWAVFIIFLGAATDTLGLPVLATWLSGLSRFLPRLLLSALIVLAGVLAGTLVRDAISATRITLGRTLGRGAQFAIITAAVITGVDQIGIDSRFLTGAIMIALAAFLGGTALAFGLGARTAVSNIIAVHYVRQTYKVGQRVRLGPAEGTIREITSTSVVLETRDGRLLVPAKEFSEASSTLITVEG